jgi:hypothetical protein
MDHPYGVQPALGLFAVGSDESRSVRSTGLGSLAVLPDEAVLGILESLPAADLARLSVVSRFLHVFCHHDDLWKGLCLEVGACWQRLPAPPRFQCECISGTLSAVHHAVVYCLP